jgi:hypothetical protein
MSLTSFGTLHFQAALDHTGAGVGLRQHRQAVVTVQMGRLKGEVAKTKPRLRKEASDPQNRALFARSAALRSSQDLFSNQNGLDLFRIGEFTHQ